VQKYRTAIKDIVKQVGKQFFSGKMDLSRVTFPIKCMMANTTLNMISKMAMHAPIYMNAAA
jgi:hypothetical protein